MSSCQMPTVAGTWFHRNHVLLPTFKWTKKSIRLTSASSTGSSTFTAPYPPTVDPGLLLFSPAAQALGLLNGNRSHILIPGHVLTYFQTHLNKLHATRPLF